MSPAQNFATYISTREINNASSSSMTAQFSRLIHMARLKTTFPFPPLRFFGKVKKKKKKNCIVVSFLFKK
jgi:hypothetical protein